MNQLSLFDIEHFTHHQAPICDPAWDEPEPPEPDDYDNLQEYLAAWDRWEKKYPHIKTQFMGTLQTHTCEVVGEQVTEITLESANTNTLVKFHTQKSAPQHDNHWVEKYWVERSGNKYWYFRYMWMSGRKIHRLYIGSVDSPKAKKKKQAVEDAIADGQIPQEIKQIIRSWRNPQSPIPNNH